MPADRTEADYAAKAAKAENAVAAVKDPELRRVAFEKILAHLLAESAAAPDSEEASKPKPGASVRRAASATRPAKTKAGPKGRIGELVDDGYFDKQRTIADVRGELSTRGYHIPSTSLSGPLQSLTREKVLRRQKVPSSGKTSKPAYAYSKW